MLLKWRNPKVARRRASDTRVLGYLTVAPIVAVFALLLGYPLVFSVWISFTDTRAGSTGSFIGLANYVFLVRDPGFVAALVNSAIYVGAVLLIKLVLGLGIASLLSRLARGGNAWRGMMLIPWALPGFVAYIIWKLLYADQGGAFNLVIEASGLGVGRVGFLSDPNLAMPSVILASVWRGFPFFVIMFMAAMQAVPRELYEAAHLDGAGTWQRFRNITLPGIQHTIIVVMTLSAIWTVNAFEAVWLITRGGPSTSTLILPVYAYFGLQNYEIGRAAAASLWLMPLLLGLLWVMVRQLREED